MNSVSAILKILEKYKSMSDDLKSIIEPINALSENIKNINSILPSFKDQQFLLQSISSISISVENFKVFSDNSLASFVKNSTKNLNLLLDTLRVTSFAYKNVTNFLTSFPIVEVKHIEPPFEISPEEKLDELDKLLNQIKPELKERRENVWEIFNSDLEDKLRASAHLMRQLLIDLINSLATEGNSRREKVKSIVSMPNNNENFVNMIDSLAEALNNCYSALSTIAHLSSNSERTVSSLLIATEQCMYILIINRK